MADRQAEMRLMLRALRLPAVAALYQDLALKAAKANLTHEAFLYELVRAECLQRDEHRVARLQRFSNLPPDKTFRSLQLERFPPLIREQLERLRDDAFLDDEVYSVCGRDLHASVFDGQLHLAAILQTNSRELMAKRLLVRALEQSGT